MAAIPKNPPKPYPPGARSGHNRVRRRITALSHRFADRYLSRNAFSGSLYAAIAGATRSQSAELHTAVSMSAPFSPDNHTPPYTDAAVRPSLLRLLASVPAGCPYHHNIIMNTQHSASPSFCPY